MDPVTTASGGQFEFKDIPAGKYTLEASGFVQKPRTGKKDLVLEKPADFAQEIIVELK